MGGRVGMMTETTPPKHIDLLVVNGDFVLDTAGFAAPVSDRQSIGQDIKHRLIESGLLLQLVGERSSMTREAITTRVLIEVDKDTRLKPGTAQLIVDARQAGQYALTADTLEYGPVEVRLA